MDCALTTLIACFSWSNLYLDSGVSWQDAGIEHHYQQRSHDYIERRGLTEEVWTDERWQVRSAENPYGRIAFGYEIGFRSLTWRIEAAHVSSIAASHDRGINSVSIGARWYPFRGAR